jgi:hypothetical protein
VDEWLEAVEKENEEIDKAEAVDELDPESTTALHQCCRIGSPYLLASLLRIQDSDANFHDGQRRTCLHLLAGGYTQQELDANPEVGTPNPPRPPLTLTHTHPQLLSLVKSLNAEKAVSPSKRKKSATSSATPQMHKALEGEPAHTPTARVRRAPKGLELSNERVGEEKERAAAACQRPTTPTGA